MTKCKNPSCNNKVVSIEGRRPKEFCSVECRTKYHNSKKAKGTGRGRPKGSKNKFKPSVIDILEAEARKDPLTNAAIGRDENGVNNDKLDKITFPDGSKVKDYGFVKTKNLKDYKPTTYPPEQSAVKTLIQQMDEQLTKNTEKVKNEMPKGLSLIEQLEWREKNLK